MAEISSAPGVLISGPVMLLYLLPVGSGSHAPGVCSSSVSGGHQLWLTLALWYVWEDSSIGKARFLFFSIECLGGQLRFYKEIPDFHPLAEILMNNKCPEDPKREQTRTWPPVPECMEVSVWDRRGEANTEEAPEGLGSLSWGLVPSFSRHLRHAGSASECLKMLSNWAVGTQSPCMTLEGL